MKLGRPSLAVKYAWDRLANEYVKICRNLACCVGYEDGMSCTQPRPLTRSASGCFGWHPSIWYDVIMWQYGNALVTTEPGWQSCHCACLSRQLLGVSFQQKQNYLFLSVWFCDKQSHENGYQANFVNFWEERKLTSPPHKLYMLRSQWQYIAVVLPSQLPFRSAAWPWGYEIRVGCRGFAFKLQAGRL